MPPHRASVDNNGAMTAAQARQLATALVDAADELERLRSAEPNRIRRRLTPTRPATRPRGGGPIPIQCFCSVTAEAGREFDKLATDLTTPRDFLTREVNLVVSLSRTPYAPARS